jgi:hypothetical protein
VESEIALDLYQRIVPREMFAILRQIEADHTSIGQACKNILDTFHSGSKNDGAP